MISEIIGHLKQWCNDDCLIGFNSQIFWQLTQGYFEQLLNLKAELNAIPIVFIIEKNPWKFLAFFLANMSAETQVFLCNPDWQQREWQQVFTLVKPDLVLGDIPLSFNNQNTHQYQILENPNKSSIMIPTGGSSGRIRFAIHTWSTLTASVTGFCNYFSLDIVNSFCILPLYHVSGLMQFIRSLLTSGRLVILSYADLKTGKKPQIDNQDFFISLVPTQLQFLLQSQPDWLSGFQTILLGGAPPWQSLLDEARKHQLALAPTYGMTETASQVVTLKPQDFLKGNNSTGQVLPHAQVTILDDQGNLQNTNKVGSVAIAAQSLYFGYYGDSSNNSQLEKLITDDLGFFDNRGYLHIVGRSSQTIITGGENVYPTEVEAEILATELVKDVCVIGYPDSTWGQVVTAVYIPRQSDIASEMIQAKIAEKLSKYKLPKFWIQVDRLPRNERGKIDYQKMQSIVDEWRA